jgi:hypothetical protein
MQKSAPGRKLLSFPHGDEIENLKRRTQSPRLKPMSRPYEEILGGETHPRSAPDARHEVICERLHAVVTAGVSNLAAMQLLAPRTQIQIARNTTLRPDLALVTSATGKLFLAAEIVSREDHRADTVVKKEIYEQIRIPRLWMVDPRYDNVEIYHSTEFGLQLKSILAGNEILSEKLIPEFQIVISELFAMQK